MKTALLLFTDLVFMVLAFMLWRNGQWPCLLFAFWAGLVTVHVDRRIASALGVLTEEAPEEPA